MQFAIQELLAIAPVLDDTLSEDQLARAMSAIDQLQPRVSADDVHALISLLPANGDLAAELNWSILHAIEASEHCPIWELLNDDDHEWKRILKLRLKNAGERPPAVRAI